MLAIMAIIVQICLLLAVLLYFADTIRESLMAPTPDPSGAPPPAGSPGARTHVAQALPIATWLVVIPIILVSLSQIGAFATSSKDAFAIPANSSSERMIVEGMLFGMSLLCLSVFILGFARCVYTVNLLDLDKWWSVESFRSRFVRGRYAAMELTLRILIALTFAYHQTTILGFLAHFSTEQNTGPGLAFFNNLSEMLQYYLKYASIPEFPVSSESDKSNAVYNFCISGLFVFVFILLWAVVVQRAIKSSILKPKEQESKDIARGLRQQRFTAFSGIFTMVALMFLYSSRGGFELVFYTSLGLMIIALGVTIIFVFVPNIILVGSEFFPAVWRSLLQRWTARTRAA